MTAPNNLTFFSYGLLRVLSFSRRSPKVRAKKIPATNPPKCALLSTFGLLPKNNTFKARITSILVTTFLTLYLFRSNLNQLSTRMPIRAPKNEKIAVEAPTPSITSV